jgi:hypothetical protein
VRPDERFHAVLQQLEAGAPRRPRCVCGLGAEQGGAGEFGSAELLRPLVASLRGDRDFYLLGADFASCA